MFDDVRLAAARRQVSSGRFTTDAMTLSLAVVEASVGLAGDYNDDGVVDAADYTVWRDNLGGTSLLNETRQLGRGRRGRLRRVEGELWRGGRSGRRCECGSAGAEFRGAHLDGASRSRRGDGAAGDLKSGGKAIDMRRMQLIAVLVAITIAWLMATATGYAQIKAFPQAEGFGASGQGRARRRRLSCDEPQRLGRGQLALRHRQRTDERPHDCVRRWRLDHD